MKLLNWTFRILVVVVLVGSVLTTAQATPPRPQASAFPPLPASPPSVSQSANGTSSATLRLPPLKAVLIVGPIDGDYGSWTTQEKQNMDLAAAELKANGVDVLKFYAPNNDWEQIKIAADGAHFLFYRGHGVYWSPMPTPTVGGFALNGGFRSSHDIRNDLHLAPNAIVMLYGCFTAGSSSIDGGPISSEEAQRRVVEYSNPFLDVGTAGYYADWFGNAFQMYVRYLFQGMTLGEAYESYFDFDNETVERYAHPDQPGNALWLDKDNWGYLKYNNAFVGLPDQTLSDLFGSNEMTLTQSEITLLAEPSFAAQSFAIQVNGTGPDTFSWTTSVSPADTPWLSVQPDSGVDGQHMIVAITPSGMAMGTYQARIHVVAESTEIENREQDVLVTLHVLEKVYATHLPVVIR